MSEPVPPEFPEEFYARYLFYAAADLTMARRALDPPALWHEACFLAREAAEKALKAFLEAAGKNAPPLHGLTTLLRECIAVDRAFGRLRTHCQRLASYQDTARYPSLTSSYAFTQSDATEAVRLARKLLDTVQEKVSRRKELGLL